MAEASDEPALACGELPAAVGRAERVRVHGRLVAVFADQWVLADATGRVSATAPAATPPDVGAWIALVGRPTADGLTECRLAEVSPGAFRANGEFARFARIGPQLGAVARAKRIVREHFDAHGFIEVTTPTRVASPGTDPFIHPYAAGDEWLITSPELHMKRLLVGGFDRIYQLAPCHRREERGTWHEPEFSMLEWYRAFADVEAVMADTEAVVTAVVQSLSGASAIEVDGRRIDVRPPFLRLSVRDAFTQYAQCSDVVDLAASDEQRYFELLVSRVEPALAALDSPVFLTDYPSTHAALARKKPGDPSVAERFELYLGGVELCNGYGELTDPAEQRQRFEAEQRQRRERGLPPIPIDEDFMAALVEGLPPCSGNALGFERLVALSLGVELQDVVAFPIR